MFSVLNIILSILGVYSILFVLNGYKETFELMPKEIKSVSLFDDINEVKSENKEKKEGCRPIYNCRRIGYFCSKVN